MRCRGPVLHRVRPDGLGADHRLGHRAEQVADPLPDRPVRGGEPLLQLRQRDGERHEAGPHQQGQLPGVDRHQHGGQQQLAGRGDDEDAAPLHEHRHLVDVAGHPGHQRAAPGGLLVQHRQVVHPPERAHPQRGQRGLGGPEQPVVQQVRRHRGDQHDAGAAGDDPGDPAHVRAAVGEQPAVERLLHGQRDDHPPAGGEQREQQGEPEALAQLRHQPQPALHRRERRRPGGRRRPG